MSPHLDDAVLSCWSVIDSAGDVTVVTVFTGGPRPGVLTSWDRDTGAADSAIRMAHRRGEDKAALAVAGRTPVHVGRVEGQYGGGTCPPDSLIPHLENADVVYAPAGIGVVHANAEHGVVRDAVIAVRPDARLYADQPYCEFRPDTELPAGLAFGLERQVVRLPADMRDRKARALTCYRGELPKLEGIFGRLAHPEQLEYEVFWTPSGKTPR